MTVKMHGFVKIGIFTLYTSTINGKPMGCREDDHCPAGYFCDADHLFCYKCLDCEDLKRGAPELTNAATSCITSVAQCGNCLIGLVADKASNKCLSPGEAESGKQLLLPYEWAVISVALFLAFLVCVAAFYVLRNLSTFKIRASTRTSVHSRGNNDEIVSATAPQSPPPYNAVAMSSNPTEHLEESKPFIKPVLPQADREVRESSDNQTARVFNNPTYVQTLQPHSYETPTYRDMLLAIQEDGDNSTNNSILDAVAERSNTPCESMSSHTKTSPARQDSNNNSDNESVDNAARNVLAQNATSIIINVIKNIDTVQR